MNNMCVARITAEYIHIMITSVKEVDNVIPDQVQVKPPERGWMGLE